MKLFLLLETCAILSLNNIMSTSDLRVRLAASCASANEDS